ncbi:MAG: DUF4982 domain-containing protein [Edaphocola sp.]
MNLFKKALLSLSVLMAIGTANGQNRTTYNFNSDWEYAKADSLATGTEAPENLTWRKVTLPAAWNEDDAFKKDIPDLSTGIVWYRKHFKLPTNAAEQKVFIEFEGVRQAGDFYVNGKPVGFHEDGVTAFGFDITDFVFFDGKDNIITAKINNSWDYRERSNKTKYQWEDKNFNANYGGIIRNVFLHVTPKLYQTLPLYSDLKTTGVYIYASDFDIKAQTATINASSEVKNETAKAQDIVYQVAISDADGKPVKTFAAAKQTLQPGETKTLSAAAKVAGLNFWSWGYGYLYQVTTTLLVGNKPIDAVTTKTGFRKTEFKDGMIYLNDRVIMVHGYAQRTSNEWPAIGTSVPAWLSDYSNGLMVESGGNLVRWMHITPSKQDIQSCDRVGLMQAMPAGDAEKDVEGHRWSQRARVMRDAIIYNKNNPSIIFYECGNESISEAHMSEMKTIRDTYDPHGGRAIGSREMLDSKVAEYGGEMLYTNKSAHIPMWAMEYSRDEGSRKYWDDWTPPFHKDGDGPEHKGKSGASYNRNMESHALENVKRWYEFWRERPGTGKRVSSGGVNIVWSETNTHHRGEENYRRSGEVDAMRIKKQNYYAHWVMWDGWVVPESYRAHIVGHWNYEPSVTKDIFVISSADKVELKLNGKSLGYGSKSDGFIFTFKSVKWQAGNLTAIGYDNAGKQVCTDELETAGQPVALRLTEIERPTPFLANGNDLALVEAEVVDAKGNRCPTALDMVNYSIDGEGEWRGGIAMGPDNYILAKSFPVEGGVSRFFVRATNKPGTITIKATADKLKAGTIQLTTKPFVSENGLSTLMPDQGLPSILKRGPTPAGQSYKVSRIAVLPKSATAGSNQEDIAKSYDDNELSDWANDGKLNTAWVSYELEREAVIDEIEVKLNNFRTKVYPLVITVDGKEVFNGHTEPTLGYYTIACKPVKGRNVKIQLTAPATVGRKNDEVEVGGKKLDDGVAKDDAKAKGSFRIIEVEFYEKAK